MQPDQRVAAHLWDMREQLRKLARYIEGKTHGDLIHDELLQDGVIRKLTVLGEAAMRVGEPYQQLHPEIPWTKIVGMRNVVTHQYDKISLDEIWTTATESAPRLLRQVESLLEEFEDVGDERSQEG